MVNGVTMKNSGFINEINDNIKILSELFAKVKDNFDDILSLEKTLFPLRLIIGNARVNNLKIIQSLSEGLVVLIEDLIKNKIDIRSDHVKLFNLSLNYYKIAVEQIDDNALVFSIDNILDAYKNANSNEQIDIDNIYQKDILKDGFPSDFFESKNEIDGSKKVAVSISDIDKIINKLNDIVLNQYQLKNSIEQIGWIETSLMDILNDFDDRSADIKLAAKFKKDLLSNISQIREVKNSFTTRISQSERSVFTLQEDILSLRMIPINIINHELQDAVTSLTESSGKKVNVVFNDNKIVIDKFILQKIKKPLEYIIHNSVEHGIETADERISNGKNENGVINIFYKESSGKITISIKDDGRGVNIAALKNNCLEMFPYDTEEISNLSGKELLKYLFRQGITASNNIKPDTKKLRGLGLYNVQYNVEKIKGSVVIKSEENNGVEIILEVPKSLTTVSGFFIKAAGEKFLIPATFISEIVYLNREDVIDLLTRFAIKLRSAIIPIYPLSGIIKPEASYERDKLNIIIVEEFGEKIGIIVDEILYHSSVIYKSLPANIERLKPLQGIVFDEEYNIVNILHIPEIISRLKKIRNIEFREKFSEENLKYKNILIVDDSEINRNIQKNVLKELRINIDEAVNGIDALGKIRNKNFDLIITDSEMPQMDGFTFIENLRKEEDYTATPVIALISSGNKSVIDRFHKLNITNVISKELFNRDVFLETVTGLLR